MDNHDIQFFQMVKKTYDKHHADFWEADVSISILTSWVASFFHFKSHKTTKQRIISFHNDGLLIPTNKGFKFNKEKLGKVINNEWDFV